MNSKNKNDNSGNYTLVGFLAAAILAAPVVIWSFTSMICTTVDWKNLGIVIGFVVGLLIALILVVLTKKGKKTLKLEYDEYQEAKRGRGYKYCFFVTLIYYVLLSLIYALNVQLPIENTVLVSLGIFIVVVEYVVYSVFNDCYFALNEKKKMLVIFFAIIAIVNLISFAFALCNGKVVVDGILTGGSLNGFCALLLCVVLAAIGIKGIMDKKNVGEEDDADEES